MEVVVTSTTVRGSGGTAQAVVIARGARAPVELAGTVLEAPASGSPRFQLHVTDRLDRSPLGIAAPAFLIGRHLDLEADLVLERTDDDEGPR